MFYNIEGEIFDDKPNVCFLSVPMSSEVLLIDILDLWLHGNRNANISYTFFSVSHSGKKTLLESASSVLPVIDQTVYLHLVPSSAPPILTEFYSQKTQTQRQNPGRVAAPQALVPAGVPPVSAMNTRVQRQNSAPVNTSQDDKFDWSEPKNKSTTDGEKAFMLNTICYLFNCFVTFSSLVSDYGCRCSS